MALPLAIIITGPSGSGKDTLRKKFMEEFPETRYSISYTTRMMRPGEIDGKDYHFIARTEFKDRIDRQEFVEFFEYNGNLYGTSKENITEILSYGRDLTLILEVNGAKILREYAWSLPKEHLLRKGYVDVFIDVPEPKMQTLEARIRSRGNIDDETICKRLIIAEEELARAAEFSKIIVNDNLDWAYQEFVDYILAVKQIRSEKEQKIVI